MIGIEVKHLLENTCNTNLSMKEIQDLKIEDVKALLEKAEAEKKKNPNTALVSTTSVKLPKNVVHSDTIMRLNDVQSGVPVFIFDIDCDNISNLKNLAAAISFPVYGLLWSKEVSGLNVESLSTRYLEVRFCYIISQRYGYNQNKAKINNTQSNLISKSLGLDITPLITPCFRSPDLAYTPFHILSSAYCTAFFF